MKDVKRTPVPLPDAQKKPTSKLTPSKKLLLSQEFISSDDDEHVTTTVVKAAPPERLEKPKTTIAIHRPKKNSERQKVAATKAATKPPGAGHSSRDSDSDSDDSSDSASLESSDDDSDGGDMQPAKRAQSTQAHSHVASSQPIPTFVPPKGFNPVSVNDKTTTEVAHMFSSVAGKEIWHITAPAGVPLEAVRQITMDGAGKGEVVLDHKGASYSFSKTKANNDDAACAILVPLKDGFKPVARITRTFHLQAVVRLPKLSAKRPSQDANPDAAASITRSTIRAPRPQLKGLRMRFLPAGSLGIHGDTLGDSDDSDNNKLDSPVGQDLPLRTEKRKHAEVNGHNPADLSTKKHKKKHRTVEEKKRKDEKKAKKAAREAAGSRP